MSRVLEVETLEDILKDGIGATNDAFEKMFRGWTWARKKKKIREPAEFMKLRTLQVQNLINSELTHLVYRI